MRISDWSSDVSSSDLKGKAQRRDGAEAKREEQNPPRIHPVGQAGQDRHGRDVAAVIDAADPASLGVRHPPFGQKRRDRKSVVKGKRVSVRVDLGGRSIIKKKKR